MSECSSVTVHNFKVSHYPSAFVTFGVSDDKFVQGEKQQVCVKELLE